MSVLYILRAINFKLKDASYIFFNRYAVRIKMKNCLFFFNINHIDDKWDVNYNTVLIIFIVVLKIHQTII